MRIFGERPVPTPPSCASTPAAISGKLPVSFPKKKYRTDQVMKLMPDITLIQKKLNWRPRISLDIGLDQTIKHFKLFRN